MAKEAETPFIRFGEIPAQTQPASRRTFLPAAVFRALLVSPFVQNDTIPNYPTPNYPQSFASLRPERRLLDFQARTTMYKHDRSKHFAAAARVSVALCALAALGGTAAHAQGAAQLFSPLGAGASTVTYDLGKKGLLSSPYSVVGAGDTVTFIATGSDPGGVNPNFFQTLTNSYQPGTTTPLLDPNAFPLGTHLIDTYDSKTSTPTAPLEIDFASGVSSFGLYGQSAAQDTYNFSFSVFNGSTLLDTVPFTTAITPNIVGSGQATFVGAQALGTNVITKVILTSSSTAIDPATGAAYTGNSNDFYFGPLSFNAPIPAVPEASTVVGFGVGTLLFAGLVLSAHKRKTTGVRQSTQQTTS